MSTEYEKDFWGKNKETNKQRLDKSQSGDEIVVTQKDENNRLNKRTFITGDADCFREVEVLCGPGKEQKQIRGIGSIRDAEDMEKIVNSSTDNLVYWHRKVFTKEEAEAVVLNDKTITNYDAIKKEYYPQKMIEDMKLATAAFLMTVTPKAEINYYKYKDGKWAGIDSYICTEQYKFMKLKKRKLSEDTREVTLLGNKTYDVWEIVNTLPRKVNELSPMKDINIRCKWNKYNEKELQTLLAQQPLNDIAIENRRQKYLTSNQYFVAKNVDTKEYTEYWVDKKSNEIVFQKDRILTDALIEKYTKANKVVAEEVVHKKPGETKDKTITLGVSRNRTTGIER